MHRRSACHTHWYCMGFLKGSQPQRRHSFAQACHVTWTCINEKNRAFVFRSVSSTNRWNSTALLPLLCGEAGKQQHPQPSASMRLRLLIV